MQRDKEIDRQGCRETGMQRDKYAERDRDAKRQGCTETGMQRDRDR